MLNTFLQLSFESQTNIRIESGIPLEVSSQHLVFVKRNYTVTVIPASNLIVADVLSEQVNKEIRQVHRQGIYAPMTMPGKIFVNGILASNNVTILNNPFVMSETSGTVLEWVRPVVLY
jgi:Hint module